MDHDESHVRVGFQRAKKLLKRDYPARGHTNANYRGRYSTSFVSPFHGRPHIKCRLWGTGLRVRLTFKLIFIAVTFGSDSVCLQHGLTSCASVYAVGSGLVPFELQPIVGGRVKGVCDPEHTRPRWIFHRKRHDRYVRCSTTASWNEPTMSWFSGILALAGPIYCRPSARS